MGNEVGLVNQENAGTLGRVRFDIHTVSLIFQQWSHLRNSQYKAGHRVRSLRLPFVFLILRDGLWQLVLRRQSQIFLEQNCDRIQ